MVNVVPWDLPRHNIHHGTSSAFSNNVPMFLTRVEVLSVTSIPSVCVLVCSNLSLCLSQARFCGWPSQQTERHRDLAKAGLLTSSWGVGCVLLVMPGVI